MQGIQQLTRDFAKVVHKHGGVVVFVNLTQVAEKQWNSVIDYWVEWNCDAWVRDLMKRKPGIRSRSEVTGMGYSTESKHEVDVAATSTKTKRAVPTPEMLNKQAERRKTLAYPEGARKVRIPRVYGRTKYALYSRQGRPGSTRDNPIDLTLDAEIC